MMIMRYAHWGFIMINIAYIFFKILGNKMNRIFLKKGVGAGDGTASW